jgi:signal transduction histidine kinase
MERIFLTIISNSIKYPHPNREPYVEIPTSTNDDAKTLVFRDHGIDVDLEKFEDRIFNRCQAFHNNKNAVRISLFMTRNQAEAFGGKAAI